jgi:trehalose-6-phosphatase
MNWMMNSASAKRAILSIRKGLERENASQSSIDLLQSLLDYDGTVTQINLQPDDIVRSDTARYLINDV